ncbi:hypothetical protein [Streptomyces sp. NPDC007088]|uniref:SCO2583 family membrane protein n=1 Tax=Streptomyces sp. NPDC007088 TaxID=3364773 RepID=UPI0036CB43E1
MAGAAEPPEGIPPEGFGSEEEYRSVVFDESFVNAARLQEFSANERLREHAPAVRRRAGRGLNRQLVVLVVLIALAFGTAVFMGVRTGEVTANSPSARRAEPLRMTVIPLVPQDTVPGVADVKSLYAHSPAASFGVGAAGIALPTPRATEHYTQVQVQSALTIAKDYLIRSSLDPRVLSGGSGREVRTLLDSRQLDQFDHSLERPRADGRHAATGWLTRLDPGQAVLADPHVPARVQGTVRFEERGGMLEVTSDHTFAYAVRPAGAEGRKAGAGKTGAEEASAGKTGAREKRSAADDGLASLLTVRREMHFRFDPTDLRAHRTELLVSSVQAGPLDCAADSASRLRPVLAGHKATSGGPSEGTNPYAPDGSTALCGTLSDSAQPVLSGAHRAG